MIKSLEVIIAITMLFIFLFFMVQSVPEKQVSTNVIDRIDSLLKLKADTNSFRTLINDGNAFKLYDSLYNDIDVSYGISVCKGISLDCNTYNLNTTNNLKTINYYFFDLNKTISISTWIK
jgi:hypothetical protein